MFRLLSFADILFFVDQASLAILRQFRQTKLRVKN